MGWLQQNFSRTHATTRPNESPINLVSTDGSDNGTEFPAAGGVSGGIYISAYILLFSEMYLLYCFFFLYVYFTGLLASSNRDGTALGAQRA